MDNVFESGPIYYKSNLEGDRDEVQRAAIIRALTHTEECLQAYCALEQSHGGRYINADLMKEIFPEYSESLESRTRYDLSVHNSCAWLAQELYNRQIKSDKVEECIFVTGMPGAGKSFFVQSLFANGEIKDNQIVFEGSLCNLKASKEKMQQLVDMGKKIQIIVINPSLRLAFSNVVNRQQEVGRGATLVSMAKIASEIGPAIETLDSEFPIEGIGVYSKLEDNDRVDLSVGIEAVKSLLRCDYEVTLAFLKGLDIEMRGMAR